MAPRRPAPPAICARALLILSAMSSQNKTGAPKGQAAERTGLPPMQTHANTQGDDCVAHSSANVLTVYTKRPWRSHLRPRVPRRLARRPVTLTQRPYSIRSSACIDKDQRQGQAKAACTIQKTTHPKYLLEMFGGRESHTHSHCELDARTHSPHSQLNISSTA